VTFLAILELAKETLVEIVQQAAYAPIYVKARNAERAAPATALTEADEAANDAAADGNALTE